MDYQAAVAFLDGHIGQGVKPGLKRIRELMEMMGDPQSAYPVIHVTGSNGKTSVARMATSLLVAHGLRVGTFISPHLENIEERSTASRLPPRSSPRQLPSWPRLSNCTRIAIRNR